MARRWGFAAIALLLLAAGCTSEQQRVKDRALFDAAGRGDLPAVQSLLAEGAGVNARQSWTETPYAPGPMSFHVPLKRAARWRETPLHYAAYAGDAAVCEALIAAGARLGIRDSHGFTPLYFAVRLDRREVAQLLLEKGAGLKFDDDDWVSLLGWANQTEDADLIKLVRQYGARPNQREIRFGYVPLSND